MMKRIFVLALLAAAPLSAQTARDSTIAKAQKIATDSLTAIVSPAVTQICNNRSLTAAWRKACPVYPRQLRAIVAAESALVASTVTPVPVPVPVPVPTPTPTPTTDSTTPQLPRSFMVTTVASTPSPGRVLNVTTGLGLFAALDSAKAGDVIQLACGTYTGANYTLAPKAGADASHWVTIRGAAIPVAEGTRINPATIAAPSCLPKIVPADPSAPTFGTLPGASYYRLIGLEVTLPASATVNYGMIRLGSSGTEQNMLFQVPHHIILDRVYIHGTATASTQRCVAFNGAWLAVIDSYLSECHYAGADAQAVGGWNGPGPFKILNNYLEASGENILFGGADPSIAQLVPSDIEVRRNWIFKPLSWQGTAWTVKNLLECKNCQRMLVEGNVLENNWVMGQNGHAILTQALTDNNTAPWTTTKDITIRLNIIKNAPVGYTIYSRVSYGTTPVLPDSASRRISVTDNLWLGVGSRSVFELFGDLRHVHVAHNTATVTGNQAITIFDGGTDPEVGLVFANNIVDHGLYGLFGSGFGEGNGAIQHYAPGAVVSGNVFAGASSSLYPAGNYFPALLSDVAFAADYSLASTSPFKGKATDGKDPGADIPAILAATAGVKP